MRRLLILNAALAALIGAHVADHALRQHGGELTGVAAIPGLLGALAIFGSLALTIRRHPRAPLVSALVGAATATGFVAVHLVPHWSLFSDPYFERHLDALSWASMLGTLAVALALALVAARSRPSPPWAPAERRSV